MDPAIKITAHESLDIYHRSLSLMMYTFFEKKKFRSDINRKMR